MLSSQRRDSSHRSKVRDLIVESAQGSARTLLVLLDKISNVPAESQAAAVDKKLREENAAIDLCRALFKANSWATVTGILANIKEEPEAIRWAVMGYCRSILMKEANHKAYVVLDCFSKDFWNTKDNGLMLACYEAFHAKD